MTLVPRTELDPPDRAQSTDLCTHCGLCCMGALHNKARIDRDEVESVSKLGLIVSDEDPPTFPLGCSLLDGTRCSVYGHRPSPCRFYRCQLLMDVEAGRETLEDAQVKTRIARDLFDRVEALRPPTTSIASLRARARAMGTPEEGEPLDREAMVLQLQFTALALYLDKHFMNHNDRQHFTSSLVGTPPEENAP